MIPYKYPKYQALLYLVFALQYDGYNLQLVNKASKECASMESMAQIGTVLPRLIEALASALTEGGGVRFSKHDIKDGF